MKLRSGRIISKASLGLGDTIDYCINKFNETKKLYYNSELGNNQSLDYYTEMPYVVIHLFQIVNKCMDIMYNNYDFETWHKLMHDICDKGLRYLDSIPPKEKMNLGAKEIDMRRLQNSVNEVVIFMDKLCVFSNKG
jgi:predicted ATP-dependent endonuclease of OLD family